MQTFGINTLTTCHFYLYIDIYIKHKPRNVTIFILLYILADVKFIPLTNGKVLLMVDGYTFHKGGGHIRCFGGVKWRCSSSKKKCRAYVSVSDNDDFVIKYSLNHNDHERPVYKTDRQGNYVKIS